MCEENLVKFLRFGSRSESTGDWNLATVDRIDMCVFCVYVFNIFWTPKNVWCSFVCQGYTPLVFTRVYTCNEIPDILQITDAKKTPNYSFPWVVWDFGFRCQHKSCRIRRSHCLWESKHALTPAIQGFFNNHSPLTRRAIIWGLVSWVPKLGESLDSPWILPRPIWRGWRIFTKPTSRGILGWDVAVCLEDQPPRTGLT